MEWRPVQIDILYQSNIGNIDVMSRVDIYQTVHHNPKRLEELERTHYIVYFNILQLKISIYYRAYFEATIQVNILIQI